MSESICSTGVWIVDLGSGSQIDLMGTQHKKAHATVRTGVARSSGANIPTTHNTQHTGDNNEQKFGVRCVALFLFDVWMTTELYGGLIRFYLKDAINDTAFATILYSIPAEQ